MQFLKEPLVHFVALGIVVYAWFAFANPDAIGGPDDNEIIVDERVVASLSDQFLAKMNRVPTREELDTLVDQHIRHEVMAREALNLGLDQGDGVIRQRLVQKMTFLSTSAAKSAVPEDETLEEFMRDHSERYASGTQVSFVQVAIDEGASEADVDAMVSRLRTGETPAEVGTANFLPTAMPDSGLNQVDRIFGRGFFARVSELPIGEWAGPIRSGYGMHLVRLDGRQAAELPALEDVRERVLFDWRRALTDELTDAYFSDLLESYEISRPGADTLEAWLTQ